MGAHPVVGRVSPHLRTALRWVSAGRATLTSADKACTIVVGLLVNCMAGPGLGLRRQECKRSMALRWPSLLARIGLAIVIVANGPVHVAALSLATNRCLPGPRSDDRAVPQAAHCCQAESCCGCCRGEHESEAAAPSRIVVRTSGDGHSHSSTPWCPCGPVCPCGTSGAAKALFCLNVPGSAANDDRCVSASLADWSSHFCSAYPDSLFHPPRA
jgi:hypothetical protein